MTYSENIIPHKGEEICGMKYQAYIIIKKDNLENLSQDKILEYLKNAKKEDRISIYKTFLKFRNIPYERDLFNSIIKNLIKIFLILKCYGLEYGKT